MPGQSLWLAMFIAFSSLASAATFPPPNQVSADYPDAAEHYVALNTLWDYSHAKLPDDPAAKSQRSAYYNASESIRTNQLILGDAAAQKFDDHVRELSTSAFKRSVLQKYNLLDLPDASSSPPRNTDVTDSMIQGIFWKALPVLVLTFLLMFALAKAMISFSVRSPTLDAVPTASVVGLPQLPEELRVVKVPGVRYAVEFISGLVIDKESVIHTTHQTSTTHGEAYTIGNDVYVTPGRTATTSSSTKVDTIWLRTPQQRETSWILSGGNFQTRAGHIISAIVRRISDKDSEFLLAYNHTTGQLEPFPNRSHWARGRKAWFVITLVGSIGFAIWIGMILSIDPTKGGDALVHLLTPLVYWIEGLVAAAIVAVFIVLRIMNKTLGKRNAAFDNYYLPHFQKFLEQATPQLERFFAPR